jgi:MYXO-CTERM domain-containing protein
MPDGGSLEGGQPDGGDAGSEVRGVDGTRDGVKDGPEVGVIDANMSGIDAGRDAPNDGPSDAPNGVRTTKKTLTRSGPSKHATEDGCACRVGNPRGGTSGALLLLLLAAMGLRRSRRQ